MILIMENKIIQSSWTLIRENPVTPVTPTPLWQWADVSTEENGKSEAEKVSQDVSQVDASTWPSPGEDFIPWDDLPDPLEPHGKCSGLNCWWDLTGRQRCADCDPPNKARLLRVTAATQRRRAERRRQAAQRTEVAT